MKTKFLLLVALALTVTAVMAVRAYQSNSPKAADMLVTEFGEHASPDGYWRVSVSSTDRTCVISHSFYVGDVPTDLKGVVIPFDKNMTSSFSSQGWKAQSGWCVFVENDTNVWCYDGAENLWLTHKDVNGSMGCYGPNVFPCMVPNRIYARLTEAMRKQLAPAARE